MLLRIVGCLMAILAVGSSSLEAVGRGERGVELPQEVRPSASKVSIHISDARKDKEVGQTLILDMVVDNHGDSAVVLYEPQDGSFYGWLAPVYAVVLTRFENGKTVGLTPRCGNHGANYDAAAVRVEPGKKVRIQLHAPFRPSDPGKYKVSLTYKVEKDRYPGPRVSLPSLGDVRYGPWPTGVFVGSLEAKEIEIDVLPKAK